MLLLPPRQSEQAVSVICFFFSFRLAHTAFALRLLARPLRLLIFGATCAFNFVTAW
jgi:hypothetical protein